MTTIDSDHREWIREAMDSIGASDKQDWRLGLREHPARFSEIELGDLLRGSDVESEIELYCDFDAQAITSQAKFKSAVTRASAFLFLAATFTASFMALPILIVNGANLKVCQAFAALGAFAFSAASGVMLNRARGGGALAGWSQYRSKAELYRIRYFRLIVQKAIATGEPRVALQSLEYFRRFQLDLQEAFFRGRGKKHAAASEKTLERSTAAVGLVTLITMATGIVAVLGVASGAALAALAVSLQAYAATINQREALNQDRTNAERYAHTREKLVQLRARLDEVRRKVASGKHEVLSVFVDAVDEILSAEHSQWAESVGEIGSALDQLNKQLDALEEPEGFAAPSPAERG